MRVFWLKGYEGASMADLTSAMGINKPSLYARYGNKRRLFLAAIDHYSTTVTGPHVVPLLERTELRSAIEGYLYSINSAIASTGAPPGCLIGSVATELAGRDEELRRNMAELVARGEAFLTKRFVEIGGAPVEEHALAELVISLTQSLAARARMGATQAELDALCDCFLSVIFGPKGPAT